MSDDCKRCSRCRELKPRADFYSKKDGKDGLCAYCKKCHYERQRERDPLYLLKVSLGARRRDAKKHGVPFSITLEDLLPLPEKCPVLGIPLKHGATGGEDASPSIDRIIPTLGYVRGNVIVVSLKANRIKNDATPDELMEVARFYKELLNGPRPNLN